MRSSWCGGGGVVPLKVKLENYMYGKQMDQIQMFIFMK